ncbi:P-loop containing nucleoside triphosphate hydrolase protein [Gyrodon lividus]|nr:P-loop containing nucleoside triphosphate hydrolase protein [Gyrodon lividus]
MRLLSPSSAPAALSSWARSSFCRKTVIARYLNRSTVCYGKKQADRDRESSAIEVNQDTFEAAGITPLVATSLRAAFPNVQKPTAMQKKLIRATVGKQDILLQDDTGSGKSFAVMLALLSKPRMLVINPEKGKGKDDAEEGITTLLIVPHRDLAYQYLHWMHHVTVSREDLPFSLAKYAQVLVRHVNRTTLQNLPVRMQEAIGHTSADDDKLLQHPPHILIATPNAVLDLVQRQPEVLRLSTLSTVVVDEVDAFLHVPNSKLPREHKKTVQKKLDKHVPDLARVLDVLYPTPRDKQRIFGHSLPSRNELLKQGLAPAHRPQLVMLSATLRTRLRSALYGAFGWIQRGKVLKLIRKRSSALPAHRLGRSAIHHVLVVSQTGDIKNIAGACPLNPVHNATPVSTEDEGRVLYDDDDDPELQDDVDKELLKAPLNVDPAMLEAVAGTFALDVPRVALLVLPATAAVRKIIFELQQLGVNAHPFNLVENEASRSQLLSRRIDVTDENPALIVATLATVRGIDFPELSHVFILGVPEGRAGDAYLHVAGRVGRFGRQGKVITVLEEKKVEKTGRKVVVTDDPRKMTILLSRIGIKPARLEHFD